MIDNAVYPSSSADAQETLLVVKPKASLLQFLRDPLTFFRTISNHPGSLAEITLGRQRFYVVSDPAVIRDILSTHGSAFEKYPPGNPKQKLFGRGLLTSEGAAQKRQRRMLLPAFHRNRLETYARQMTTCIQEQAARWPDGGLVDVAQEMNDVTLEIIGQTLLGVNDLPLMRELGKHLHTMLNLANRFVVPWGDWLMNVPLPSTIRYRRAIARLDKIVYGLIAAERRESKPNSLIALLVNSKHPDGSEVTDEEIRDEVVTMIVAGHETVAVGLTWSLFLLARHVELQNELAARVAGILGDNQPAIEDYPRLEFVQHAFAEAMRLYPPIWILGRRNFDDYVFRNFEAPKGSVFLVYLADLHRRAEYFTDPDAYKPERWLTPDWPAHAYIPFGGGERRCIGERFAWMEAVFVLASLLKRWRFSVIDDKLPAATAKLTLHPSDPVRLRVERRAN